MKNNFSAWLLLPLALAARDGALAQTPPDAGSIQQQIERERAPLLPRKAVPERPVEPAVMTPQAGFTVTVRSFRFAGNTLLPGERLAPAVAGFLNRPLDFNQLKAAAIAVANAYREAGWIVRVYLPEQDIVDGVVVIQIVEAVFGGAILDGPEPSRIKSAHVLNFFGAQQKTGEPVNAEALDRALLLADDLPGVAVSGSLREGAKARETDLVVKLADEPRVIGKVAIDNTGSRGTGPNRITADLNLNSPFGMGDLLTANAIYTQGSDYLRLGASVPVGVNGWRVGVNTSHLDYKLVASEFDALEAKGKSDSSGLEASYPVIRSRLKNLYFMANADHKTFDNQANGATTTRYKSDSLGLGLFGNIFDNLGGGGANAASLIWTNGKLNLDGSPNQAADAVTTRSDGSYGKLRYSLSRQQVVTERISLFASIAGQRANKNLDSSEKFFLGGATGVRAYPSNEGGGSNGDLASVELRAKLPQGFTLTGFYDWGRVTINRNNDFAGAPALNDYVLKGAGLTLAWQAASGPSVRATWAHRIGENPNPTATGNDQDGSLNRNRLWLSAVLPF
jgi:hemolysin activation/secretion protein